MRKQQRFSGEKTSRFTVRRMIGPVLLILFSSVFLSTCAPYTRIVTIQRAGTDPSVTGRLIVVHRHTVIVDTAAEPVLHLTLKAKRPEYEILRRRSWTALAAQSVRVPVDSIRSVLISGQTGIVNTTAVGLGIGVLAGTLQMSFGPGDQKLPHDPGELFLHGILTIGLPAVVCGVVLGLITSEWERVVLPGDPSFEEVLRKVSQLNREVPPELEEFR